MFSDEIANMTQAAQAKILRAVEYGEFERLGSEALQVADVRLISAARTQGKAIVGLSRPAASMLFEYRWPGNLLELQRVVHTAVAMTAGDVIHPDSLLLEAHGESRGDAELAHAPVHPAGRAADSFTPPGSPSSARRRDVTQRDMNEDLSLRRVEERHILHVLAQMGGCKRRTARALGVSRSALDRKLSSFTVGSSARDGALGSTPMATTDARRAYSPD